MLKKAVSLLLALCMLCSMANFVFAADDNTPIDAVFAPSFSGGTNGEMPEDWSGVNIAYGNQWSNWGQISNFKVGQTWGANGYAVYNNYLWTGDITYTITVDDYDQSSTSDTDHRAHIIFNYKDAENYYFIDTSANSGSTVYFKKKVENVDTVIASAPESGIGRGATVTINYNSTAKTTSATAKKSDGTVLTLFTDEYDNTFVGGKIGVGAKSSSFIDFSGIIVRGMAIDQTPKPEPEVGLKLTDEAVDTVFVPVITTSGSIPEWWTVSNTITTKNEWGAFTQKDDAWNKSGYLSYDKYEWEQKLTYKARISNYAKDDMSSFMCFMYQDSNNYYAVEFNSNTKQVNLIKKVNGTVTVLASYDWGESISNHIATVDYDNGKMSASVGNTVFFTDVEDPDNTFTSGKIGFAYNRGGFHIDDFTVSGLAREWVEGSVIAFPEREKVYRKLPTITSATEVPVPDELKSRVVKTYPDGLLKAVIMDFDDGTQNWCEGVDSKIIAILNKYNMRATFNLSANDHKSGYTDDEIAKYASIYRGHEIATHMIAHTEPADMDNETLKYALETSKAWFEQMTAKWGDLPTTEKEGLAITQVGGWAYPGGGKDISAEQIAIAEAAGFKYGRRSSVFPANDYRVKIPESFFNWHATASFASSNGKTAAIAHQERYLASDLDYMTVFYSWQHGWDVVASAANPNDISAEFDTYCKTFAKNSDTIWNPGCTEYVDYVNASRQLTVTLNDNGSITLTNPSNAIDVWARVDYKNVMIPAGETKTIGDDVEEPEKDYALSSASYTSDADIVTVTADVTKGEGDSTVIAAVYNADGRLVAFDTQTVIDDSTPLTDGKASYSAQITANDVSKVSLFVWDSVGGIKPLCESVDCVNN